MTGHPTTASGSDGAGARRLAQRLAGLHPSDAATSLGGLEESERLSLFRSVPAAELAAALAEMERDLHPERILAALPASDAGETLARMADDDATDLLGLLPAERREALLDVLPPKRGEALRDLLAYAQDRAGGIMTTDLVALPGDLSVDESIREVRRQEPGVEEGFYTLFVVDADGRLRGTVTPRKLVLAEGGTLLEDLAEAPPATVAPDTPQEEVAHLLHHYDLPTIPVLDDAGRLLGHVTWDDVMDVMEAEQTEDILRLSGTAPEEELRGGWQHAARSRLPWLFVNLLTGALAASVVYLFQSTIDEIVILASVMPVIAALGGNAGTQALAVTLRRLTLDRQETRDRWRVAGKELLVGLVNGAALGIAVGLVGLAWHGDLRFGAVVLIAMWGNLVCASLAGSLVPIVLERVGADPAVASSVFVTTFTDLVGFFLLLGLATKLLL